MNGRNFLELAHGMHPMDGRATSWLRIKNSAYSQTEGRDELFASRQGLEGRKRAGPRFDLALR
jgi:hypothetical protein